MGELPLGDKVRKVLEAVGVRDVEGATGEQVVLALGRILSVKIDRPYVERSVHEVTKEVRRALELVVKSPISKDAAEAISRAVYTNPPFDSEVLNMAYRELLRRLLDHIAGVAKNLTPMWRRRLVNLTVENIFIIATAGETREYRSKIFEILKPEGGVK